jgi:hypothetical protein
MIMRFRFKSLLSSLLIIFALFLMGGCGPTVKVSLAPDFKRALDQDVMYVAPFLNTLVPENFSSPVFNNFIDDLNMNSPKTDVKWFYIVKEDIPDPKPDWLTKQAYITGEVWSYIEESGCCSTNLRVNARVRLYEPGRQEPAAEVYVPMDSFFEHDRSNLELERERLAKRLAREMADQIIRLLEKRPAPSPGISR